MSRSHKVWSVLFCFAIGIPASGRRFAECAEKLPYDGGPIELTVACWDVAWQLQPGFRLRVDVSGSNFPEYSIHPNTDILWSLATETRVVHQTVLAGEQYPSCVILPLDR